MTAFTLSEELLEIFPLKHLFWLMLLGGVMCSNYGATEVKSLTIYMGGPTYTRHHEQSLTAQCRPPMGNHTRAGNHPSSSGKLFSIPLASVVS